MKKYKLDDEEKVILSDFETGKSIRKSKDLGRYVEMAKNTVEKTSPVSIRINEKDLIKLKAKAIEVGVPYQTFIKMALHQIAENKFVVEF